MWSWRPVCEANLEISGAKSRMGRERERLNPDDLLMTSFESLDHPVMPEATQTLSFSVMRDNKLPFFFFGCTAQHVGSQFPDQGSNPCPLQWKCGVLTTGLPGNSSLIFLN